MESWAKTRAEAEAQPFSLPARYEDWGRFASLIDGYVIAEEMRLAETMDLPQVTGTGALSTWVRPKFSAFEQTGEWQVETVLELRLLVFFKARQLHFVGEAEHETFKVVHNLLKTISQRTGLPYDDPQAEVRFAEQQEVLWNVRYAYRPHTKTKTQNGCPHQPTATKSIWSAGVAVHY